MDNFYRFKPELDILLCGDLMTELKQYIGVHPNAGVMKDFIEDMAGNLGDEYLDYEGGFAEYGLMWANSDHVHRYTFDFDHIPEAEGTWKSILQQIEVIKNFKQVMSDLLEEATYFSYTFKFERPTTYQASIIKDEIFLHYHLLIFYDMNENNQIVGFYGCERTGKDVSYTLYEYFNERMIELEIEEQRRFLRGCDE
jgi:hypothetical protein